MDLTGKILVAVPYVSVARYAALIGMQFWQSCLAYQSFMAVYTIIKGDGFIKRPYPYRIRKIAQRKCFTVVPTIYTFNYPFVGKVMGRMAIVTGSHRFVAGIIPTIKLLLHHMTIHTSIGIIR